ncbi:hypothetical protein [Streptomyces heilongjiangensis]|uniref:Uncharacterized protein n=1 Tax=Streptomyces heilongjiangensis TaxID=945052 RepID=A0ABW1B4P3_9ACTN|nr:hypothetical protein [Streptomyces heilongjiangensis]MDC2951769.1 hypothetical protein [Streptomyces heilongjiangensis]
MTERTTDLFAAVTADQAAKQKAAVERLPSPLEVAMAERGARLRAAHQTGEDGPDAA